MDLRVVQQKQELQNILTGLVKSYASSPSLSISELELELESNTENSTQRKPRKPRISKLEILNLLKKIPRFYTFLSGEIWQTLGQDQRVEKKPGGPVGRSLRTQSDSGRIGILICLITLCFQRWNGHFDLILGMSGGVVQDDNLQNFLCDTFLTIMNTDEYEWILLNQFVIESTKSRGSESFLLTGRELQPLLGQIIIMMIDELELIGCGMANDHLTHIRGKLLILSCMNSILSCIIYESKTLQSSFQNSILADRIAQFLPGLFSALAKLVLRKNINENHKVIMACFHIIGLIVSACLNDEACLSFLSDPIERFMLQNESKLKATEIENDIDYPYTLLTRDEKWLESTVSKLEKIIPSLCSFLSHDLWKVRLAVVRLSSTLLKSCHRTLASGIDILVQTLLQGLADEYSRVSEFCNESIHKLREQFPWFQSALEENLKNVLQNAPDYILQSDKRQGILMSLTSHFSLIKKEPQSIHSAKIVIEQGLDKLFDCLLHVFTPDLNNSKNIIHLQENFDSLSFLDHSAFNRDKSWKLLSFSKPEFVHFNDDSVFENVLAMFSGLISVCPEFVYEKVLTLYDSINELANNSKKAHPLFKNDPEILKKSVSNFDKPQKQSQMVQCFLLLNEFTRSCHKKDLVEAVIPLYLSSFQKICTQKSSKVDTVSLLQTNLLLQGIANISLSLDSPEKLHFLMMDSLYFALTFLAHPNYNIKSAAHNALEIMGLADRKIGNRVIEGDLVVGLVSKYSDYLFDRVLEQIRYPTLYPFSPRLVGAIVGVCGSQLVSTDLNDKQVGSGMIVIEVVESVVDILDSVGSSGGVIGNTGLGSVEEFVGVLCGVLRYCCLGDQAVKALAEGSNLAIENRTSVLSNDEASGAMEKYIQKLIDRKKEREEEDKADPAEFFKEYHEKKEMGKKKSETDLEENMASFPSEPEVILSQQETVASIVLERAMFLMTSDSVRVRLLVLEAVKISIALLAHQPKKLYPLIHILWPLLLRKCQDPSPSVMIASLEVLQLICQSCGEFVRQRIERDVMDRILQVLTDLQAKAVKSFSPTKNTTDSLNVIGNVKKNQILYFEESSRSACDLFYSTLSSLQEIARYIPLKQSQGQKLVLILVSFLNCSLYTPRVTLKSTQILRNLMKSGFSDYIWIVIIAALGGAKKSFRKTEILDARENKNARRCWMKSKEMVNVFGNSRDFMESCKELVDMFDFESQSELRGLL